VRSACIDIGSNTTRLLVAERHDGGLREVLVRRMFVPLLPDADGRIATETIGVLAAVVAAHAATARECDAERVHVVATAAIRAAANRDALCAAVALEAGLAVRVLDGAEEARLAFAGATRTLRDPPSGMVGVVDVGGGSCELVTGSVAGGADWFVSVPVGSGVLTDGHVLGDPPSPAEVQALRDRAAASFASLGAPRPAIAYAVGGSATSLRMLCGDELSAEALERALALLCRWPVRDAAQRLSLARERVRLLPAGLVLLGAAARAFGGVALQVARGGLREGVVLEDLAGRRAR
jgi:exopolyphosphatase / guanosine-5'-triphosphate,3'-diphosphate pyrophosphatase